MVKLVKTTFVMQPELYAQLDEEAKRTYGTSRKLSALLNDIVASHFVRRKELFGISKPFDAPFFRDKKDRI